jgi:hypothetical protein
MDSTHPDTKLGLEFEEAKKYMEELAFKHARYHEGKRSDLDDDNEDELLITVYDKNNDAVGQVRGAAVVG